MIIQHNQMGGIGAHRVLIDVGPMPDHMPDPKHIRALVEAEAYQRCVPDCWRMVRVTVLAARKGHDADGNERLQYVAYVKPARSQP